MLESRTGITRGARTRVSGWYCMRDLYKRSRSHRVRSHSNSAGRKPFWAARREVWDRFHAIKKLKEGHTHKADQLHSIICMVLPARESILRARDGETYRFNMKCFSRVWKPIFQYEGLVFSTFYISSMY